jgi:hypothetical protein
MEAMVRRLLRRAGDSYRLAAFPLAQTLCRASGIPNAQLALRHVVEAAFKNAPHEAELRDLILASDLDAHLSRTESATRLQVSRRHLQRYRAQAVSILARHIRDLIGPVALVTAEGESLGDPLDMLAEMISHFEPGMAAKLCRLGGPHLAARANVLDLRSQVDSGNELGDVPVEPQPGLTRWQHAVLRAQSKQINGKGAEARDALRPVLTDRERDLGHDAEARFELEWLMFLRARHRSDAAEALRVASNLRRIAQDRAVWRSRALLAQAESRIRLGRIREATDFLDEADRLNLRASAIGPLASAGALRAEIALLNGDDPLAERLASGAYIVLRGRHYDSYRCLTTIARARLRMGKPWACSDALDVLAPLAWDRVSVTIERARHLRADGFTRAARACAAEGFRVSASLGYEGLAARAAATIGATFDEASQMRREWYLRALSHLLTTRDHSIAGDLFWSGDQTANEMPFGSFGDEAIDVLYSGLMTSIPQLATEAERDGPAARAYLRHLSQYVFDLETFPDRLKRATEAVDDGTKAFAYFMLRFVDDVEEIVRPAFQATASLRHRDRVEQRLKFALSVFSKRVRPVSRQQFLVG